MPTVDVIVPCYNYARYLRDCVGSVLSQPGVDVRVSIIDDHSSDETPVVGAQLSREDARVHFRRHAVNQGHIATYNEGLEEATADYVVLLSADDLLTPGSLARATELMEAHPNIGMTYGCSICFDGQELPRARTVVTGTTVWPGHEWARLMCEAGRNFINCPEVVMRTRVQKAIGGYRASLPHSGDMEMWLRAAVVSDIGWIGGADQAYYRVHNKSMQRTVFAGALIDMKGRHEAFVGALQGADDRMRSAGDLLRIARHALARQALDYAAAALRAGTADRTAVEALRDFANSLQPGVTKTRRGRALDRLMRQQPVPMSGIDNWIQHLSHRVRRYLEWRRWSRTGVY
jgi:Glycosyl transferase family 2